MVSATYRLHRTLTFDQDQLHTNQWLLTSTLNYIPLHVRCRLLPPPKRKAIKAIIWAIWRENYSWRQHFSNHIAPQQVAEVQFQERSAPNWRLLLCTYRWKPKLFFLSFTQPIQETNKFLPSRRGLFRSSCFQTAMKTQYSPLFGLLHWRIHFGVGCRQPCC